MSHELVYFLKVNVAIALFYAFYRLFFYKDTFFQWRRTALLCFLSISILYPLLNIQGWIKEQEPMLIVADFYSTVILPELTIEPEIETVGINWKLLITSSLWYIYIGVVIALLLRFFFQFFGIIRLALRTPVQNLQETKVHVLNNQQGPFSFFKWIFIHPDAHTEVEIKEILTHEQTHARQWHSIDVLTSELMCILCWFNPFIWLMKREVRNNLEFLADHKVLETGYDSKTYQYHLLGLAYEKKATTLYNSFNVLPLKIRIKMMNKKRTKQIGRTKYLIFLPLAALLLIISNIEAIARSTEKFIDQVIQPAVSPTATETPEISAIQDVATETSSIAPQQEKKYVYKGTIVDHNNTPLQNVRILVDEENVPTIITNEKGQFSFEAGAEVACLISYSPEGQQSIVTSKRFDKNSQGRDIRIALDLTNPVYLLMPPNDEVAEKDDDVIFEVVEQMPEFPGGTQALMRFLAENVKYPVKAQESGTQGRVIAQFVVDKEGNVTNPKIARSVSPELDAEALRIISAMPKWLPGKQRGKAVSVKYTVPVMFRLTNNDTENKRDDFEPVEINGELVYSKADNMPEFPEGMKALMEYLTTNIKVPKDFPVGDPGSARVIVQFIIDKSGNIKDPVVVRSVDPLLDQEAIKLINNMPKWTPGKVKGEAVSCKYTVPVMFRIEGGSTVH